MSNGGQWEDKSSSNHIKLLYHFSFNPLTYYLLVYLLHFLHWAILITPCLLFLSWMYYMDMKISHFRGLLIQWNRQHQILLSCIVIYRCPEPLVLCRQLTVSIWSQCHLFYPVWYICPFVFCHYPRYPMFWHYKCTTYIAHKTVLHAAKLSLPRDSIWRTRN